MISFLKRRNARRGRRVAEGVLLVGPPGTGKRPSSAAVADEVPFLALTRLEFVELFVGVSIQFVDLFADARKTSASRSSSSTRWTQ